MKLTNKKCEHCELGAGKLSDGRGLYLHSTKSGKYWRYKYRINGTEKLLALGVYPIVSLAEAREKHQVAYKFVSEGVDPQERKQNEKKMKELNSANTFEAVAREWHEATKAKWSEDNAKRILKRLEKDIFPEIGYIPINEITASQLYEVIAKIQERGANEIAKRNLQNCGRVFRFGMVTEKCGTDISTAITDFLIPSEKEHYSSIEIKELPKFLEDLEAHKDKMYYQTYLAIRLLMLVFLRPNKEFLQATWDEIDFDERVWIVPKERMKMKKEHIVPLSKQAIELLKELRRLNGSYRLVFAGRNDCRKPMSENTILKALYEMGYKGRMTGHGFRALAMSTIMEKLGYREEVPDRQLAHIPRGEVQKAYNRAKFLDERIVMMQEWADYIDSLKAENKVVPIKSKAA